MNSFIYISLDEIIAINDSMIEEYGGSFGIRELGLLHSALMRPQATFAGTDLYTNIFTKAASLFHSLIFNHAFVDGNKRTTMAATARFLSLNSSELQLSDEEFVSFPLTTHNKRLSLEEIASFIKNHSKNI